MKDSVFRLKLKKLEEKNGFPSTTYQEDIYRAICSGRKNLLVEAVAGSGKTTTILSALRFLPPNDNTLLVAFNKHIAEELQQRVPEGVSASTLHSVAFKAYKEWYGRRVKVDSWKTYNILKDIKTPRTLQASINKMIGLLKNYAISPDSMNEYMVEDLVDRFDIEWSKTHDSYLIPAYEKSCKMKDIIDFDDMIFFPTIHGAIYPKYDNIFVDESQDLNPAQLKILAAMSARLVFVGDTHQAIYGFRGSDPYAMKVIEERFSPIKLPLSICYRCGQEIVRLASNIVPHIEAAPNAPLGNVLTISGEEYSRAVQPGDYTLCRTTAPLVSTCLSLLSNSRKATVLGRDIGANLCSLVDTIKDETDSSDSLENRIHYYKDLVRSKLDPNNPRHASKLAAMEDKLECLSAILLSREISGMDSLKEVISSLFSEEQKGITLSTIHKAKGLEADNVFLLRPDLLPHPMSKRAWERDQESNLEYVAITRARENLSYVVDNGN